MKIKIELDLKFLYFIKNKLDITMAITKIKKSKISNELKNYTSSNKDDFNVLAMPSVYCSAGKYKIDDNYENFLKLIADEVINETPIHYLEKPHPEYNQVKIDIDLRFNLSDDEIKTKNINRRYDTQFLNKIVEIIVSNIEDLIDTNKYTVYIQEKKKPKLTKDNKIKDGIHIIIPSIVMHNNVLHKLRKNIVEDDRTEQALSRIKNISTVDDVIDSSIIDRNCWFLYGNGKNNDIIDGQPDFYETTIMYKYSNGVIKKLSDKKIIELHNNYESAIKLFSNYNKKVNVKYKDEEIADSSDSNEKMNKSMANISDVISVNTNKCKTLKCNLGVNETKSLLRCLNASRADNYESWWRVGQSLYNMDERNFEIWCEWSKQSDKFNPKDAKFRWHSEFKKNENKYGFGIHTIKRYAEEDNPLLYKKYSNLEKNNFLDKFLISIHKTNDYMGGKSFDITNLVNHIINYINDYSDFKFVCADPEGVATFYRYHNHKWDIDKGATSVYLLLRNTLREDITKLLETKRNQIRQINSISESLDGDGLDDDRQDNQDEIQRFNNHNQTKNQLNALIKIGKDLLRELQSVSNKERIIKDMKYECYDKDFIEKLDINENIFICNNGVIDTKTLQFREGEMGDMATISCGIDFPLNMDEFEKIDINLEIDDFLSKLFVDDEIRDYVINILSEKLSGHNNREEFHIMTGSGSNGKSQFFHFLMQVFGTYYHHFDNSLLNTQKKDANSASPAVAGLRGCRIAETSEPKANQAIETDKLKEYIGGDPLTGRFLNKNNITFKPQYKMFMMCNDIPEMPATDDGVWRKIRVVPFESKFVTKVEDSYKLDDPEKFPNHFKGDNSLTDEKYARWAPVFLERLFNNYKYLHSINFCFNIPSKVLEATENYKANANMYEVYFRDRIKHSPGYHTTESDAYLDFKNYISQNNFGIAPNRKVFICQIEKFIGKITGGKFFKNYRFGDYGVPM